MSKLVIVESPHKATMIKKYLGKSYDVTASVGHIRDLPAAKLSVDIKNDFAPKYAIVKGKEKLVKELKEKAANADEILLATDPDREGEAISWHLATVLGLPLDEKNRVKFNEINENAVKKGIASPEKIDMDLVDAQQARRILDRLVGYKLSPFVSQKIHRGLSAGRVQSVAVRLVVDREEEIRKFVPEEYWSLDAKFTAPSSKKAFKAAFTGDETGKIKLKTKEETDAILARLQDAEYSVSSVKKGTRRRSPAPPFTTSTMQQDASRKLGFQAKRTMKIAQELYEGMEVEGFGATGLITYMRTDSLRISEEARQEGNAFIEENYGKQYLPEKPRYFKTKASAQDGHEAIRPTVPAITPEIAKKSLTPEQFKLYSLIWKRFMASRMTPAKYETTSVKIDGNGHRFTVAASKVIFDGFMSVYTMDDEDKAENCTLAKSIDKDTKLSLKEFDGEQHFTQPPAHYTEASLVRTLEELGIGRPSTYAPTITTILARHYVIKENKNLYVTELGEVVNKMMKEAFPTIVDVNFTANMEALLDGVSEGTVDWKTIVSNFYPDLEEAVQNAEKELEEVKVGDEESDEVCELCGRRMVIKYGPHGRFLACPGFPECRNTKPYYEKIGVACPKCGKDIVLKKTQKGRKYYGCIGNPECDFMVWQRPSNEKCPVCGSILLEKGNKLVCSKEGCGFVKEKEKEENGQG